MTVDEATRFREAVAEVIPEDSRQYKNVCRAYDIFVGVRDKALERHGRVPHGVGLVFPESDELTSELEDAIEEAVPYNGKPHSIYDPDIEQVIGEKCELDGALLVQTSGLIPYAGVELELGTPGYKRRYGIPRDVKMKEFMGFEDTDEPVGFRTRSALNASHYFTILTLGEGGEINLYYCGDRLYNSAGRKMHWELADPKRLPQHLRKVIELRPSTQISQEAAGPDQYQPYTAAGGTVC